MHTGLCRTAGQSRSAAMCEPRWVNEYNDAIITLAENNCSFSSKHWRAKEGSTQETIARLLITIASDQLLCRNLSSLAHPSPILPRPAPPQHPVGLKGSVVVAALLVHPLMVPAPLPALLSAPLLAGLLLLWPAFLLGLVLVAAQGLGEVGVVLPLWGLAVA